MEPGREVELKLSIPPDRLARVMRSPQLRPPGARRAVTRALRNVYYDTPRLTLREQGIMLRVRESGRRYLQTVKSTAGSAAGLFRRGEWETPLTGPQPDLARVQQLPDLHGTLSPIFRSDIRRTTRLLQLGNSASIEMAIDRGVVQTTNASAPICELELELRDGNADALFDLALALNELAPLHLETVSKSDRGYLLLTEAQVASRRATPLRLDTAMSASDALSAILNHSLVHLIANEAAARQGYDPEGVHQMRLALRRLRSALTVFRPLLPGGIVARLRGELKWLAAELGAARDLDVLIDTQLAPVTAAFGEEVALQRLEELARNARGAAYERVRNACDTTRYTALLLEVSRLGETRTWHERLDPDALRGLAAPALEFANALLTDRHQKARKRGRRLGMLSADERHLLRLAVKKLRYAADSFRSLYSEEAARPYLKRLSRLQEQLGLLNDIEIARRFIEQFAAECGAEDGPALARAGGLVVGWHARNTKRMRRRLAKQWRAFRSAAPFWRSAAG
jgi:inorganic triphosphatase YgiF